MRGEPFSPHRFAAPVVAILLAIATCATSGCSKASTSPTGPSADSQTSAAQFSIDGFVKDADAGSAISGARIAIAEGANHGTGATADEQGRYRLADLQSGALVLHVVADGYDLQSQSISLAANQSLDFTLRRASAQSPTAPSRFELSGTVTHAQTRAPVAGARLEVLDGTDRGATADVDAKGRFAISVLAGTFSIEVSADAFTSERRKVSVASNQTLDVALTAKAAPAPTGPVVRGMTVDGVSNDTVGGATIRVEDAEAISRSDGTFEVALVDRETVVDVTIVSDSTVERETRLRLSDQPATFTLMPKKLDLRAFDQMFRGDGGVLHRWADAPRVVVQRRVLKFTNTGDTSFVATATTLSEHEVNDLLADLTWALPLLTGENFRRFDGENIEMAEEGAHVEVSRSGVIVIAHYEGLTDATAFWGYTKWAWSGNGEVRAAAMMLDRAFETSGSGHRRTLHAHELGHALGYNHVDARESVMNSSARVEPNRFDRDGSRIAFLRPPLNRSPDADPDSMTLNQIRGGPLTWSGAP